MAKIYMHDDTFNVEYRDWNQFYILHFGNLYFIKNVIKRDNEGCYAILIENDIAYVFRLERKSKKLLSTYQIQNKDIGVLDLIDLIEELK